MSLDEYEALLVEKKKALNSAVKVATVDATTELKGLKVRS